jgi:hypothetical protein
MDERLRLLDMVGKRVEIPVHFDLWMRGARTGTVCWVWNDGSLAVRMDHRQVRRRLKVPYDDVQYMKVL